VFGACAVRFRLAGSDLGKQRELSRHWTKSKFDVGKYKWGQC
jgi:hypothetical protein